MANVWSALSLRSQETFDMAISPTCCDFSLYSSYLHLVAVGQPLSLLYGFKSPRSSSPHRHVGMSFTPEHCFDPIPSLSPPLRGPFRLSRPGRPALTQHSSVPLSSIRPATLYRCFLCTLQPIQAALGWEWVCSLDKLAVYRRVNTQRQTRDNHRTSRQSNVIQTKVSVFEPL